MNLALKFDELKAKFESIERRLADPSLPYPEIAALAKERSDLKPVADLIDEHRAALAAMADAEALVKDPSMRELAQEEFHLAKERAGLLEHRIKLALLPKDEADDKGAILEIRAGTGGDEAALFAGDLLSMYKAYGDIRRWDFEIVDSHENELGGLKEAIIRISGKGAFGRLKFESGAHRVQRVPATESQGRVHTSAATVAVMPEAREIDVEINPADLRIDTYRASGAGGQKVNKTDSAIRITHIPSGVAVQCQDERSQFKNKDKAMTMLRSRLYEAERQARDAARAAKRKAQVGTGDRSDKIRTYNFPQNRFTDHRIGLTLYKLDRIISGEGLDEVIDALATADQIAALAEA
ncbi:MAG: peptide chain release factor 1 [Rickettsiales bacterium]|jgi:peptide chain release factor 1|nr:peptide chain release factor 1 [Rickettsiales bacterium]